MCGNVGSHTPGVIEYKHNVRDIQYADNPNVSYQSRYFIIEKGLFVLGGKKGIVLSYQNKNMINSMPYDIIVLGKSSLSLIPKNFKRHNNTFVLFDATVDRNHVQKKYAFLIDEETRFAKEKAIEINF